MKLKPIKPILEVVYRVLYKMHIKNYPVYQPVLIDGKYISGLRDSFERWEVIKKVLIETKCKSLLDLGSAEGFYVINAARLEINSHGIDGDWRRLFTALSQVVLEKISNVSFSHGILSTQLVSDVLVFDSVLCLSVVHHIMYKEGYNTAKAFVSELIKKTRKVLFFEMGSSKEIQNSWATKLPDMGSCPDKWIEEFLLDAGAKMVEIIGYSLSNKKETKRAVFKVIP